MGYVAKDYQNRFLTRQISFDPLDFVGGKEEAKQKRNDLYKIFKMRGIPCNRFVLKGQLQKYSGFEQPDERIRDVYYIQVNAETEDQYLASFI